MPPKRSKSQTGSAGGPPKWETGILTTPFVEEVSIILCLLLHLPDCLHVEDLLITVFLSHEFVQFVHGARKLKVYFDFCGYSDGQVRLP